MDNNLPDNLNQVLNDLGQRFGTSGEALWHAWCRYCQIYALSCLLGGVIFFGVVLYFSSKLIVTDDKDDQEAFRIARCAVMTFCVGFMLLFTGYNLSDVLVPQGAAINALIGLVAKH